jgi:hypothetical protein
MLIVTKKRTLVVNDVVVNLKRKKKQEKRQRVWRMKQKSLATKKEESMEGLEPLGEGQVG